MILQMATRLQFNASGTPYGFGNLSIKEINDGAELFGVPNVITNSLYDAYNTSEPKILFINRHYMFLYTDTMNKRCIFDSFGRYNTSNILSCHARIYRFALDNTNDAQFQSVQSDSCGLFALFALYVYISHQSKFLTHRHFEITMEQFITPHDFAHNEFAMVVFGVEKRVGEEFTDENRYAKFHKMLKFISKH